MITMITDLEQETNPRIRL